MLREEGCPGKSILHCQHCHSITDAGTTGGKQNLSAYLDKYFKTLGSNLLIDLLKLQPPSEVAGKKCLLTSIHVLTTRATPPWEDLAVTSHFLQYCQEDVSVLGITLVTRAVWSSHFSAHRNMPMELPEFVLNQQKKRCAALPW